jgi:hypothetical protein
MSYYSSLILQPSVVQAGGEGQASSRSPVMHAMLGISVSVVWQEPVGIEVSLRSGMRPFYQISVKK